MTTAVRDEIEARAFYKEEVERADERIRAVLSDPPGKGPDRDSKPTLWGLRGKEVVKARQQIEILLNVESIRSGFDSPSVYGEEIKRVAERAQRSLQAEKPTRNNRERIPAVIEELGQIVTMLERAREEVEDARQQDKKTRGERWPRNKERLEETDRWGDVLGWSLDLLKNFHQTVPGWWRATPPIIASALADLADEHPELNLRETVINPLDNSDIQTAWVGLYKLIQRFEEGELSL